MNKILVLFSTMSGNAEVVAHHIKDEVSKSYSESEVDLVNMVDANESIFNDYDFVFIGSSTWTDGSLNPITEEFFDKLASASMDLTQKKFAVFGLGESYYPDFCPVAEKKASLIKERNGVIVGEFLKLDGYPDDNMFQTISVWVKSILEKVN